MQIQRQQHSSISIGVVPAFLMYDLYNLISNFKENHPDIEVKIDEMDSSDLYIGVQEHLYDYAFTRYFEINEKPLIDTDCSFSHYYKSNLCILVPSTHSFHDYNQIDIKDLADENICILKPHTVLYGVCMHIFETNHIHPNIIHTSNNFDSIMMVCAKESCLSIMPTMPKPNIQNSLEYVYKQGFKIIPLTPTFNSYLSLCYSDKYELSNNAKMLLDYINENKISL